jgi:hypothetical protein
MADKKISALTAASTPLAGTEVLPIVQGASTVKVAVSDLTAGRSVSATSIASGLGLVGTPAYTFTGDLNTGVWSPAADTVAVSTAGAERVRVTDVGNVGFGTASPAAYAGYTALTLEGATNGAALALRNNSGTVTAELAATPTETYFKTVNSLPLTLGTNNAERMRLDTSGNLGLGTTAPTTGSTSNTATLNAGIFITARGSISATSGVATTISVANGSNNVTYIVSCTVGASDPVNYSAVAIVSGDAGTFRVTTLQTAVLMAISVSGTNIQATQTSGGTQTIQFCITRVS